MWTWLCGRKKRDGNVNDHVDHKMRRQKQVLLKTICVLAGIYDC